MAFRVAGTLLMTFLVAAAGCGRSDEPAATPALRDLDGQVLSLSDFEGKKAVMLVFFTTWCPGCMEEISALKKFQKKYRSRGVEVIAVAVRQSAPLIRRLAEDRAINYRLVLDADGSVARAYGVTGIPALFGINKAGRVCYTGHDLPEDADRLVKEMLTSGESAAE